MSEKIEISNLNGIIRGTVTSPENTIKGVLICLHGGPGGNEHGNTDGFDQIAAMAEEVGFATVQFSFYGNGNSDGTIAEYSLASQKVDFEAVVDFAKKKFKAPIHVIGESAGATIASLNWREDVASYILLWPAFDLLDTDLRGLLNLEALESLKSNEALKVDGVEIGRTLAYEILTTDFSKSFDLPNKPIFMAHGKADDEVPYQQSLAAIETAKSDLLFFSHPTADHGFKAPEARSKLLQNLEKWLSALG